MRDCVEDGADIGESIGSIFGEKGETAGRIIGTAIGAVVGVGKAIGEFITGGCYITTATCEAYGKPDNCYELTAFRKFRDDWLRYQPDGRELISRYYHTAPEVVNWIDSREDRVSFYHYISRTFLMPCLMHIERGENEECKNTYIEMMEFLYREKEKDAKVQYIPNFRS